MCGRLNVIEDPLSALVSEALGMPFHTHSNSDLRPTQTLAAVIADNTQTQMRQQAMRWGIHPSWAKKILINAQAETVHQKPTFKRAFHEWRCIVPCSGWYEWSERSGRKQKYLFSHPEGQPLYMAAIAFPHEDVTEVVTLTTQPNTQCRAYHHRMPLIIDERCVEDWLFSEAKALELAALPVHETLQITD